MTDAQRIFDLAATLRYVVEVRGIECHHAHKGPDDSCAACQAEAVLSGESPSAVVRDRTHKWVGE